MRRIGRNIRPAVRFAGFCLLLLALPSHSVQAQAGQKKLLWGDTHLHTSYSFDAFMNNNWHTTPETAYRFAMGMPVIHPYHRARVQLDRPLDFLAVSDHAESLGAVRSVYFDGPDLEDAGLWMRIKALATTWYLRYRIDNGDGPALYSPLLAPPRDAREAAADIAENGFPENALSNNMPPLEGVIENNWHAIADAADRFYRPGEFTTLIAWEWTATPGGANLHRIVISNSDAGKARQFVPFGYDDSPYPEDLWDFLERTGEATGVDFIAVPHNSNVSKGFMFDNTTLRGEAFDSDYAARRLRWEPVAEITQIKGDSETHPILSPGDEFADFESYGFLIQRGRGKLEPQKGDYLRSALRRGLEMEAALGVNPYRLGLIGSTDSHTGLSSADEKKFYGKMATDSIPANKSSGLTSAGGWDMAAAGLAAVWARENTREAIMDAMRRREVYATSGPRITLRFNAGKDIAYSEPAGAEALEAALAATVPMGGIIEGSGAGSPDFYVEALRDPLNANLDRIQIVKGWLDDSGATQEKIYDVALSDPARRRDDGSVDAVENTVDLTTGVVDNRVGAVRLYALWKDPEFDPAQAAFYYARVLQIPTVRHSHLDALALGMERAEGYPRTIQERAYSSPIWYRPGAGG